MLDGFHDVRFPSSIALGSRGGPVRRTEVVQLASGHERRIARWATSRRRFNAGYGVRSARDISDVIAFFEAREGRRYAFRWLDPFDHSSSAGGGDPSPTDQALGAGDGTSTTYALRKEYQSGAEVQWRTIALPIPDTVIVAIDGIAVGAGEWSLSPENEIVFATPPAPGTAITAGFKFEIPARFDTDELTLQLEPGGGSVPAIPIVEVRA